MNKMNKKALLNVKEMCEYLGIGQTKARELLGDPKTILPFVLVTDYMHTREGWIHGC